MPLIIFRVAGPWEYIYPLEQFHFSLCDELPERRADLPLVRAVSPYYKCLNKRISWMDKLKTI